MNEKRHRRTAFGKVAGWGAAAGAAAAAYMAFEAQWVNCRMSDLQVPDLPAAWSGLKILHLTDVHAGVFAGNERSLAKAISWAKPLEPDLVFLTGDVLGDPRRATKCLELLAQLEPRLGKYAVTGNHEYGISKSPLARLRQTADLWKTADVTLLNDSCAQLPARGGNSIVLCGADYLTGGFGLLGDDQERLSADGFAILLIHEPPELDSALAGNFPLTFAGHTHGGQIRVFRKGNLVPFDDQGESYLSGVHPWGGGLLVVSRGIGTSFVPFRLMTRPEATLWRLV